MMSSADGVERVNGGQGNRRGGGIDMLWERTSDLQEQRFGCEGCYWNLAGMMN